MHSHSVLHIDMKNTSPAQSYWQVCWNKCMAGIINRQTERETDGSDCGTYNDILLCKPMYCTRCRVTRFTQVELGMFTSKYIVICG